MSSSPLAPWFAVPAAAVTRSTTRPPDPPLVRLTRYRSNPPPLLFVYPVTSAPAAVSALYVKKMSPLTRAMIALSTIPAPVVPGDLPATVVYAGLPLCPRTSGGATVGGKYEYRYASFLVVRVVTHSVSPRVA